MCVIIAIYCWFSSQSLTLYFNKIDFTNNSLTCYGNRRHILKILNDLLWEDDDVRFNLSSKTVLGKLKIGRHYQTYRPIKLANELYSPTHNPNLSKTVLQFELLES